MSDTTEIETYRHLYDNKYEEIEALLANLPAAALTWKPFEGESWNGPAGALGWLVAHALSSTVYLLRRAEWTVGRIEWSEVDGDEGSQEFGPANHEPAYLRTRAKHTQEYVHHLLDSLSETDLAGRRSHPNQPERQLTVRYDIQHALEHLSQHIGHAQLTRQLWDLAQR
jgi:hypothetical protein